MILKLETSNLSNPFMVQV